MGLEISLGIDFGSMGYRAAGVIDRAIISLPAGRWGASYRGWITLNSSLMIPGGTTRFSSIKYCIEKAKPATTLKGTDLPAQYALQILQEIKEVAESSLGGTVAQTVIAVPATYSESRRAALLRVANQVGLTNARLVNDAIMAAMDFSLQYPGDAVFLVYDSGYAQCEIAVIGKAQHQFRALSYGSLEKPSGRLFDDWIVKGCIKALQERGLEWILQTLTPTQWLQLQHDVQRAKEQLAYYVDAYFPIGDGNAQFLIPINRSMFESYVERLMSENLRHVDETVEGAHLSREDISHVLVLGGTTRVGAVRRILAEHIPNSSLKIMTDDAIARGAAAYAANLMGVKEVDSVIVEQKDDSAIPAQAGVDFLPINVIKALPSLSNRPGRDVDRGAARVDAELFAGTKPEGESDVSRLWEYARSLDPAAAKEFLNSIKAEAEQQLKSVSKATPRRHWRIQKAYDLLKQGQYKRAVEETHSAQASDSDNYQVLEDMIDIHLQAASHAQTIDGYENAIRWLNCAYSHDQSRTEISDLIANRHFLHARQLFEQGDMKASLNSVKDCLKANPGHLEALEFKQILLNQLRSSQNATER